MVSVSSLDTRSCCGALDAGMLDEFSSREIRASSVYLSPIELDRMTEDWRREQPRLFAIISPDVLSLRVNQGQDSVDAVAPQNDFKSLIGQVLRGETSTASINRKWAGWAWRESTNHTHVSEVGSYRLPRMISQVSMRYLQCAACVLLPSMNPRILETSFTEVRVL